MSQGKNILNFFELIDNQKKIEIPIIQRDYAQGREDKKEIRNNFLNALHESISNNRKIQLDFIYGSKIEESFQPLDGQQRLTTLFLLHWYACMKENIPNEVRDKLKKFTYETRITSREFCKALIENSINVSPDVNLSEKIKDSKWFFLSWDKDPTINAMLRTIDDINAKFFSIDDLWGKLTTENLVSFYYVELEEIGLTDDLYIKMNARGKLLSSFENFKASFQQLIDGEKWEDRKSEIDKFIFKMDTCWTDFFWKHFKNNNAIDNSLMKFISTTTMIRLSIEKRTDRISIISQLNDNYDSLKVSYISKETYNYIYQCFELYSKMEDFSRLSLNIPFYRHKPSKDFFTEIVSMDTNSSYTQKVYFYALTEYFLRNSNTTFSKEKLTDWMRVVRNILSRGSVEKGGKRPDIIRSPETFDGVINLIKELSEGCADIYKFLCENNKIISSFAKYQVDEELKKSKIIVLGENFKQAIHSMEDLNLFKGRISFVLDCINYQENDIENFAIEGFIKIKDVIMKYLNDDKSDISNDIRRGLLTIEKEGEYKFYDYWSSYWYAGEADKRCLIENYGELEYYIYNTNYSDYLRKLILELTKKDIQNIIDDFIPPQNMPNWKIRLIKEEGLLNNKNKSNYIAISSDEKFCYLLKSIRSRDVKECHKVE